MMMAVQRLARKQRVALFATEVRHVYDGHGVAWQAARNTAPGCMARSRFLRLQHRQGAEQARGHRVRFHPWACSIVRTRHAPAIGSPCRSLSKRPFRARSNACSSAQIAARVLRNRRVPARHAHLRRHRRRLPCRPHAEIGYPHAEALSARYRYPQCPAGELALDRGAGRGRCCHGNSGGEAGMGRRQSGHVGIPDLTLLPPSTRLQFPSGATLVVDLENAPCRYRRRCHRQASSRMPRQRWIAAATHKRGVTAWVEREGDDRAWAIRSRSSCRRSAFMRMAKTSDCRLHPRRRAQPAHGP